MKTIFPYIPDEDPGKFEIKNTKLTKRSTFEFYNTTDFSTTKFHTSHTHTKELDEEPTISTLKQLKRFLVK
jgi:hypothetical protein